MDNDFLKELEYLGVTARIKRLSESLFYNIKELYRYADIDIEPSWHLVLLTLKHKNSVTMYELSQILNISKPAITKMIKKMQDMNYVLIYSDSNDSRKKVVELSDKAKKELPRFEQIWSAGQRAVKQILESNPNFMSALDEFELQHDNISFSERAIKNLQDEKYEFNR